jgi:hypothetical protein
MTFLLGHEARRETLRKEISVGARIKGRRE